VTVCAAGQRNPPAGRAGQTAGCRTFRSRRAWYRYAKSNIRLARDLNLRTRKDHFIHLDGSTGAMKVTRDAVEPGCRMWSRVTPVRAEHSMAAYGTKLRDAADALFGGAGD